MFIIKPNLIKIDSLVAYLARVAVFDLEFIVACSVRERVQDGVL